MQCETWDQFVDSSRIAARVSVIVVLALALPSNAHEEGTAYLVFARMLPKLVCTDTAQDTPLFEISQCFPTRPLADAQEFVAQLGRGRPPRP